MKTKNCFQGKEILVRKTIAGFLEKFNHHSVAYYEVYKLWFATQ